MGILERLDFMEGERITWPKRTTFLIILVALVLTLILLIPSNDEHVVGEYEKLETNWSQIFEQIIQEIKIDSSECPEQWTRYSSAKCLKLFPQSVIQSEARDLCEEFDSKLVSINSEKEQKFVENFVQNSTNVWISVESRDTNILVFENFLEEENEFFCYVLRKSDGKWVSKDCNESQEFVCEKDFIPHYFRDFQNQLISTVVKRLNETKRELDSISAKQLTLESNMMILDKESQKKNAELNSTCQSLESSMILLDRENRVKSSQLNTTLHALFQQHQAELRMLNHSLLPIGFLYTQLPNQSPPHALWPQFTWTEVTNQYAGLFFRAEGAGSAPFGQSQAANQSDITNIWTQCVTNVGYRGRSQNNNQVSAGAWSVSVCGAALHDMRVFKSRGEVRPKNTAVKIWKRTQ